MGGQGGGPQGLSGEGALCGAGKGWCGLLQPLPWRGPPAADLGLQGPWQGLQHHGAWALSPAFPPCVASLAPSSQPGPCARGGLPCCASGLRHSPCALRPARSQSPGGGGPLPRQWGQLAGRPPQGRRQPRLFGSEAPAGQAHSRTAGSALPQADLARVHWHELSHLRQCWPRHLIFRLLQGEPGCRLEVPLAPSGPQLLLPCCTWAEHYGGPGW